MALSRTAALLTVLACAIALSHAFSDESSSTVGATLDIDRSIHPGDDFYHYANGNWLRTAVIPAGQPSYDTRAVLNARTSQRVRDLIQEAAQTPKASASQKVGDYYASFIDQAAIEA